MQIRTKAEFLTLSREGLLGNTFRSWPTLEALATSGYRGWLTIRALSRDSRFLVPWVPPGKVLRELRRLKQQGARVEHLYFQEVPSPTVNRTLNAEAKRSVRNLCMKFGTDVQLSLREDLEQNGRHAFGAAAIAIIRTRAGDDGYESLGEIWDRYPDSVIEFSAYERPVGTLGQRTIVWEVRNY